MDQAALSTREMFSVRAIGLRACGLGLLIGGTIAASGHGHLALPTPHLHLPRLWLLAQAPLAIRVHIGAALTALAIGIVLMAGVKGSRLHRTLGYGWIAAMAVTAFGSLFIRVVNPGHWSFIHFFSGWVLIALPIALVAARRRNIRLHRRLMTGLFIGGLLVAGAFTFVPGRLMYAVFFG